VTTTWPVGQVADYAIEGLPGEPPLAIREFPDHWQVFIETAHLTSVALETVEREPSKRMYAAAMGAAMLGGSIGASVTNKRSGMLVGAGIGLLFAALLGAVLDDSDELPAKTRVRRRKNGRSVNGD
jgi:hypothetical protein